MKNILFYGDSNTWGFDPVTRNRYPYEKRWTSVCAHLLGAEYCCVPAGMNGRTTVFDDPLKDCRNGLKELDCELQTHKPLDLLVIMLGTNDLKYTDAAGSAAGMETLVEKAVSANERFHLSSPVFPAGANVLLISPVLLKQNIGETGLYDSVREAEKLRELYAGTACKHHLEFLDAAAFTEPSKTDGVHLDEDGHLKLGAAAAAKILQILKNNETF